MVQHLHHTTQMLMDTQQYINAKIVQQQKQMHKLHIRLIHGTIMEMEHIVEHVQYVIIK